MKPITVYALGRVGFGVAALAAPALSGTALAGRGAAEPEAQAFLRGMGGREVGLGLGILAMLRTNGPVWPLLVGGVLADSGDLVGMAGMWEQLPPVKRLLGVAAAGGAAAMGVALLATSGRAPGEQSMS
jgi:hypothetical protein